MPHLSSVSNRIRRRPASSAIGGGGVGGGSSAPAGPAGGVLGGAYPDPDFAVNMATQAELDAAVAAQHAITLTAGGGLTGGGDLSSNRTFNVGAGAGIQVNADDVEVKYGTGAGTACEGNDSRLTNSRSPTGSAGGALAGSYPNPTLAGPPLSGTKIYWVSDTNGGPTDRKLTFMNGVLTAET